MKMARMVGSGVLWLSVLSVLCHCGLVTYPGQPGVVTNNYAKIDMEYLEQPGLYVYEVVYDNRPGGEGVGAILTKLYPGARTYTSNVRTNADGSVYRVKAQYDGAEVQMISIPKLNQIHISPNAQIELLVDEEMSYDEVDDRNLAEEKIFTKWGGVLPQLNSKALVRKLNILRIIRLGTLQRNGNLAYQVTEIKLGKHKFIPSSSVHVETGFFQNSIHTDLTPAIQKEAREFLEKHFPKGYKGPVELFVKDGQDSVTLSMGIHTLKTAEASGIKIIHNASNELADKIIKDFLK